MDNKGTQDRKELSYEVEKLKQRIAELELVGRQRDWAEERLKESQERFSKLLDASSEGIIIHDKGKIVDVSKTFADMFGYKVSELIGIDGPELIIPELRKVFKEKISTDYEGVYEVIGLRKDGSTFPIDIKGKPIFYEGKELRVVIASDTTYRKKIELQLHKINDCFLNFKVDPKKNINALVKLCGDLLEADCAIYNRLDKGMLYTVGLWNVPVDFQLIDKPDGHVCYDVIQGSSSDVTAIRNLDKSSYAKTDPNVKSYKLKTYVGTPVKFSNVNIGSLCVVYQRDYMADDNVKNIIRIIASAIGVEEERRRAEDARWQSLELYRSLVKASPEAIILSGLGGNIIMVNNQAAHLHGYEHKEDMIGKSILDVILPEEKKIAKENIKNVLKIGNIKCIEHTFVRQDNSHFLGEMSMSVVKDAIDKPEAMIVIIRDITERKEADENLNIEKDKAQNYFNMVGVIMVVLDVEGKVSRMNKKGCEILGYSEDEILGKNWFVNFLPKEDSRRITDIFNKIVSGDLKQVEYFENNIVTKNNEIRLIAWHNSLLKDKTGHIEGTLSSGTDITDSRRLDKKLKDSEKNYKTIFNTANDCIFVHEIDSGKIVDANQTACDLFGYSKEEFKNITVKDISLGRSPYSQKEALALMRRAAKEGPQITDWMCRNKDGELFWAEVNCKKGVLGDKERIFAVVRDISQRKQMEDKVKDSQEQYRIVLDSMRDSIHVVDSDLNIVIFNKFFNDFCDKLGIKAGAVGSNIFKAFPFLSSSVKAEYKNVFKTGKALMTEEINKVKGDIVVSEVCKIPIMKAGQVTQVLTVVRDVTEKIKIEKNLMYTRFVFDNMGDAAFWIDSKGKISYVNEATCNLLGYSRDELLLMSIHDIDINFPKKMWTHRWGEMKAKKSALVETHFRTKDGMSFPVEITGNYMLSANQEYICAIARDISERDRIENALRESEQEKAVILDSLSELVLYHDKKMRLVWANKAASEFGGLDSSKLIGRNCYDVWHNHKKPCKECPVKRALKTGEPQSGEIVSGDGRIWFVKGYPVKNSGGNILGVVEVALNITERKKAEKGSRENLAKSRRILEETVIALAATAERRDPYTAGHQRRVAQLACAIAKEMHLDDERIEGIRMAAIIHDVGKVYVPAEILSKPSKLSDLEFSIIKTHPQIGYEILEPVEFPWPVALIVYQHHEKLDGSGYPKGVSDDNILIEAKILTVADVVEAMASHRPYRAALGIDKALKEVSSNKGILYDSEVVNACVRLFKKRKFKFS